MTTPFPFVANTVLTAAQLNAVTTLPVNARVASYTLVVGDVGQRVQMTNASATTITVNTGIFAALDSIWIQNMGAGTCTITAGTATVTTAGSLALAQYAGGLLYFTATGAAVFFPSASSGVGTVKQVQSATLTTAFVSGAAGAYANITGLSVNITPATATNKILIMATVNGGTFMAIKVTGGNTATGYSVNSYASADSAGNNDYLASASMLYLDSPATTSAITYQVQSKDLAGGTSYINRTQTTNTTAQSASTITVMEIVA